MPSPALLEAVGIHTFYGASHILHGVDFRIGPGETVGLMGRNGMGKSTLIRSMLGIVPVREGRILAGGQDLTGRPSYQIVRTGIAYVPEGRGIFGNLSVRENLVMSARSAPNGSTDWTLDRVLATFPRLAERLGQAGDQLSGGEQQMLAIGRALMSRPRLLLLDEPSLGLAPLIVKQIFAVLKDINQREGMTIFLVEQNAFHALKLADRGYVMVNGRITLSGAGDELLAMPEVRAAYLEGGH